LWLLPKTLDNALRDSGSRGKLYKYFVLHTLGWYHNDRTTMTHRHHNDGGRTNEYVEWVCTIPRSWNHEADTKYHPGRNRKKIVNILICWNEYKKCLQYLSSIEGLLCPSDASDSISIMPFIAELRLVIVVFPSWPSILLQQWDTYTKHRPWTVSLKMKWGPFNLQNVVFSNAAYHQKGWLEIKTAEREQQTWLWPHSDKYLHKKLNQFESVSVTEWCWVAASHPRSTRYFQNKNEERALYQSFSLERSWRRYLLE
jgi:hypothetical protein